MKECCRSTFCEVNTHKAKTSKENSPGFCSLQFSADKVRKWFSWSSLSWLWMWFPILCVQSGYVASLWNIASLRAVVVFDGGTPKRILCSRCGPVTCQKQKPKEMLSHSQPCQMLKHAKESILRWIGCCWSHGYRTEVPAACCYVQWMRGHIVDVQLRRLGSIPFIWN